MGVTLSYYHMVLSGRCRFLGSRNGTSRSLHAGLCLIAEDSVFGLMKCFISSCNNYDSYRSTITLSEVSSLGIGEREEKKIKIIVDGTCEVCGILTSPDELEIHLISHRRTREDRRDPSLRILVACRNCHGLIHTIPIPKKSQRIISKSRDFFVRRDIRKLLGYIPAPYSPPETIDLAQIYDDGFKSFPAW